MELYRNWVAVQVPWPHLSEILTHLSVWAPWLHLFQAISCDSSKGITLPTLMHASQLTNTVLITPKRHAWDTLIKAYREEYAAIHRRGLLKWLYVNYILPMGSRMKYATFTCFLFRFRDFIFKVDWPLAHCLILNIDCWFNEWPRSDFAQSSSQYSLTTIDLFILIAFTSLST